MANSPKSRPLSEPPRRPNAQGPHEGSPHRPEEFDVMNPAKQIDQRAQRNDPANRHTVDPNARPDQQRKQPGGSEAPKDEAPKDKDHTYVHPAGRKEQRDPPEDWSKTDERSDESFPASDPPGTY